jgi:hypothetical protein
MADTNLFVLVCACRTYMCFCKIFSPYDNLCALGQPQNSILPVTLDFATTLVKNFKHSTKLLIKNNFEGREVVGSISVLRSHILRPFEHLRKYVCTSVQFLFDLLRRRKKYMCFKFCVQNTQTHRLVAS